MNLADDIYNNEDAARVHLESVRWPDGIACPHCGGVAKIKSTKMTNKPSKAKPANAAKGWYHCGECLERFTVRTDTIYARSHVPLHKWVLATHLLCASKKGMSAHQLHRMIGVTYKTAWFMFHRIRESMLEVDPAPLGSPDRPVQADETYFGTKDSMRGKSWDDKKGHSNKMSVVALVSAGKSRTFHVNRATVESVREILVRNIKSEAELHTDESRLYKKSGKEFAAHKTVRHSSGEYVRNRAHVNNAENYFSIFKRGMRGVYQHCSERHLQRYLTEFDFRYNNRDIDDFERAAIAFKGAEGKRLTYRRINNQQAA